MTEDHSAYVEAAAARAVPDELVERAKVEYASGWRVHAVDERMRAALAAVAPDIAAAERARCAAELERTIEVAIMAYRRGEDPMIELRGLVERWEAR